MNSSAAGRPLLHLRWDGGGEFQRAPDLAENERVSWVAPKPRGAGIQEPGPPALEEVERGGRRSSPPAAPTLRAVFSSVVSQAVYPRACLPADTGALARTRRRVEE